MTQRPWLAPLLADVFVAGALLYVIWLVRTIYCGGEHSTTIFNITYWAIVVLAMVFFGKLKSFVLFLLHRYLGLPIPVNDRLVWEWVWIIPLTFIFANVVFFITITCG